MGLDIIFIKMQGVHTCRKKTGRDDGISQEIRKLLLVIYRFRHNS